MADNISDLLSSQNSLTETERILVISLLSALSIVIICLITLIALTCRKNMKSKSGSYNRSISRTSIGKPVLREKRVRLSLSRLNSRYSDGNFAVKRDSFVNRSFTSNPLYFENVGFQTSFPERSEPADYSSISGSGSDGVFSLQNEKQNSSAGLQWY
ncbi:uncharacterized protein LOC130049054 [Ostrea edulis]|uniref:uncharacterized protein LOC130049054 n=1 Tax=Ostrea edulis TaxID=37623 RepID=UPI0024AE8D05|nr:uncharacterized protein LOC130049054 [Ostrea edulis]